MVNQNRQCFFFTENRTGKASAIATSLLWKNTRMYMNKMTVSEEDQFEISGFFSINSGKWSNLEVGEFNNKDKRKQITKKLSAASGTVHIFTSGINLTRNFNWRTVMGFNSFEEKQKYASQRGWLLLS